MHRNERATWNKFEQAQRVCWGSAKIAWHCFIRCQLWRLSARGIWNGGFKKQESLQQIYLGAWNGRYTWHSERLPFLKQASSLSRRWNCLPSSIFEVTHIHYTCLRENSTSLRTKSWRDPSPGLDAGAPPDHRNEYVLRLQSGHEPYQCQFKEVQGVGTAIWCSDGSVAQERQLCQILEG